MQLNSGSLTEGIPLDVPPGPAQAMPDLTLAYNSGTVSEQHSPQGAAGWVGEGRSMGLGEISWAEHNVTVNNVSPGCQTPCPSSTWQNSWELTDPFGTSTALIPPTTDTATYADDASTYTYCANNLNPKYTCPVQFHTANETYAKVYAYVGPNFAPTNTWSVTPPCWRVYLTNGVMEEFGCTYDSLQWYPVVTSSQIPGGTKYQDWFYPANFLLDLITNPEGDQVHITYQADSPQTVVQNDGTIWYPRDTQLAYVTWDSPDCVNAAQACDPNVNWHPHYRVQFNASNIVTRLTNSPSNCNPGMTGDPHNKLRCDDPLDLSPSGLGAPLLNGTLVLNDAAVQINNTGNGRSYNGADANWNTLRDYQMSYEQSGPSTHVDPVTGLNVSAAGYLDLTALKEVGDDGTTALPATTFGYTSQTEYYEDGTYAPTNGACGPSWNTGGNGGTCDLWSESYDGNSRYLSSISNGQGRSQSITWMNARNNTHGTNANLDTPDWPQACNGHEGMGYPCDEADDQAWSRAVVVLTHDTVTRLTQNGQGGAQTTQPVDSEYGYEYHLTYPLAAQECGDCVAGMYWGDETDRDYLDYYNGRFMGFAWTMVYKPDGSAELHTFYSTEGWGVYNSSQIPNCSSDLPPGTTGCHSSPWWDVHNAGHGLETSVIYYEIQFDTDYIEKIKQITNSYAAACPPSGAGSDWNGELASELDQSGNPMVDCDVQLTQSVTQWLDDTASPMASDTEAYTNYDAYGHATQQTSTVNGGGSSPTTTVSKTQYSPISTLAVPAPSRANSSQEGGWGNGPYNGLYMTDLPTYSDTENGSGAQSACDGAVYDTKGEATQQSQYTACAPAPSGQLLTTTTYDASGNGNAVGATDPDGHAGCTTNNGSATSCTTYDSTTQSLTTSATNTLDRRAARPTARRRAAATGSGQPRRPTRTTRRRRTATTRWAARRAWRCRVRRRGRTRRARATPTGVAARVRRHRASRWIRRSG